MGCPTEVTIGDNLTFSVNTHDPDTGIATDADAVPTYRVYEESNETAILSGDVDDGTGAADQFNDANTTGFYIKTIACTVGNGFEEKKAYTVYIEATVGGDKGSVSYGFRASVKTGYALSAAGLDSITTTGPAGGATNFREMIVALWRRFFGKATMTATTLTTFDDAGTAAATEQPLSDDATTQTQGKATDA